MERCRLSQHSSLNHINLDIVVDRYVWSIKRKCSKQHWLRTVTNFSWDSKLNHAHLKVR